MKIKLPNGVSIHLWNEEFVDLTLSGNTVSYTRPDGRLIKLHFSGLEDHIALFKNRHEAVTTTNSSFSSNSSQKNSNREKQKTVSCIQQAEEEKQTRILDLQKEISNLKTQLNDRLDSKTDYLEFKSVSDESLKQLNQRYSELLNRLKTFDKDISSLYSLNDRNVNIIDSLCKDVDSFIGPVEALMNFVKPPKLHNPHKQGPRRNLR